LELIYELFENRTAKADYLVLLEFSYLFKKVFFVDNELEIENTFEKIFIEQREKPIEEFQNIGSPKNLGNQKKGRYFVNYFEQGKCKKSSSTNYFLDFNLYLKSKNLTSRDKCLLKTLNLYYNKMNSSKNEEAYENLLLFLLEHKNVISEFFQIFSRSQNLLLLGFSELLVLNSCMLDSGLQIKNRKTLFLNVSI